MIIQKVEIQRKAQETQAQEIMKQIIFNMVYSTSIRIREDIRGIR